MKNHNSWLTSLISCKQKFLSTDDLWSMPGIQDRIHKTGKFNNKFL